MSNQVTIEVRRSTVPARTDDAVTWLDDGLRLARDFDGCLGGGVMRDATQRHVVHAAYRFADEGTLRKWECSAVRRRWLLAGAPFVLDAQVQRRTGVEGWFDEPRLRREVDSRTGGSRAVLVRSAPLRWKQAVAIWVGMFPMNILFSWLIGQLGWWTDLPLVLRSMILVSILAPLMTFLMMPTVTRLLRPWLRRNSGVIRQERSLLLALDDLACPTNADHPASSQRLPFPERHTRESGSFTSPMP